MPGLALAVDPLLVILFRYRREAYLLVELVGREQHILEHRGCLLGIRDFDEDAERQGVVDHRLADVENVHPALRQHAGDGRGEAGAIFPGDVDQDDFAQGAASAMEKAHILPTFAACGSLSAPPTVANRRLAAGNPAVATDQRFAPTGPVVILPGISPSTDRARCDPAHLRQTR
ncbi:hypothetical protein FQZ97_1098570 [compost metagenome]